MNFPEHLKDYRITYILLNQVMRLLHNYTIDYNQLTIKIEGSRYTVGAKIGPTPNESLISLFEEINYFIPINGTSETEYIFKVEELLNWLPVCPVTA